MTENLYTGRIAIADFLRLIESCHFPPEALVLAEQIPEYVIDNTDKPQDLLRFTYFAQNIPFASYTSGRIFQQEAELRWEKQGDKMQLVYLGSERYTATLQEYSLQKSQNLSESLQWKLTHYYLFGERLKQEDLDKMGKAAWPGDFAQVRIPRLLRYPVRQDTRPHVRLGVREYIDTKTGETVLFRFQSLEPAEDA